MNASTSRLSLRRLLTAFVRRFTLQDDDFGQRVGRDLGVAERAEWGQRPMVPAGEEPTVTLPAAVPAVPAVPAVQVRSEQETTV